MNNCAFFCLLLLTGVESVLAQCDNSLPGDLNGDSLVTTSDLTSLLSYYGNDYTTTLQGEDCAPVEYHGYTYAVTQIGEQCWFAENLRAYHYRNGDSIYVATVNSQSNIQGWAGVVDTAGVCLIPDFSFNSFYPSETDWYYEQFGLLYSKVVIIDERQICPVGWSVPKLSDFNYINSYYPTSSYIDVGTFLNGTGSWNADNEGCASDLYGLGFRGSGKVDSNSIYSVTISAVFWSIADPLYNIAPAVSYASCGGGSALWGGAYDYHYGRAIRCLKD